MDRRIASTMAVLVAVVAFHQRPGERAYGSDVAQHASAKAQTSRVARPAASPASAATPPTPPAPTCTTGDCEALVPYQDTGPWAASCDRFASHREAPQILAESVPLDGKNLDQIGRDPKRWCVPADRGTISLRFLIITLPDPVTTHLALYFDRTIEAVEAAAQRDGFFLDRYWLPWPLHGGAPAAGDYSHDLRVNGILDNFRSKQPGLLIFTKSADATGQSGNSGCIQKCVMYAFLVSESPTSGVNRAQFENAVRYAGTLGASSSAPLRVVGPFFSGSVPSVIDVNSDLVSGGQHQGPVLNFASGTMTSAEQAASLRAVDAQFEQTLHDDTTAQQFLLGFLKERGLTANGENIAILQEDETRYGNARASDSKGWGKSPVGQPLGCGANDPAGVSFSCLRRITFPRELSRLRNASPDSFGAAPAVPGQSTPIPSQGLSWAWKDTSRDEDRVPAFSGQQEPLSQQAVMLSISDVIRRENIKYVGIVATDVFDILFLSKFLKITAPNVRLFLLDADLLMVGTGNEGRELDGTLAVTTYPLFARNADWTSDTNADPRDTAQQTAGFESSVDIFPSRTAEGIYNAVLLQLNDGKPRSLREYADPLSGAGTNNRPALWVTVVGRSGFWPVARSVNKDSSLQVAPSAGSSVSLADKVRDRLTFDPPTAGTLFLQGLLLAWGVIHLLGTGLAAETGIRWLGQVQVNAKSAVRLGAQYQAYYLVCGTLALNAMLLLIAISFAWLWWDGRIAFIHAWLFNLFYLGVGLVGVVLAMIAGWIAKRVGSRAIGRLIASFPWILYGTTLLLWASWHVPRDGDGIFFAMRALNFGDGVSPLLPVELLLLMYYAWACIFIRKVRLSESKQVGVPDLKLLGSESEGLNESVQELKDGTDDLVFDPKMARWIVPGFVTMFLLLLRPWEALHSVEGPTYDFFVVFLVGFICLLIVLTWARYLYIWNRLQRILRGLERTSLRRAFDRLPETYSWSMLWYGDAARRWYTISARSVECFQALKNCAALPGDERNGRLEEMQCAFQRVVDSDDDEFETDERQAAVEKLQNLFVQTAEWLLANVLKDQWTKDGGSDTLDAIRKKPRKKDLADPDWTCRLLAEEFVALRFVGLIHFESAQLTNLVVLLSIGFVLALASVASYPFLAERECVWTLAGVFILFGAFIILSFAQMSRDAILSRLSRTDPGKLDWSFYLRVASYGGVPLLALLTSQFPPLGRFLLSWLEPALNALH